MTRRPGNRETLRRWGRVLLALIVAAGTVAVGIAERRDREHKAHEECLAKARAEAARPEGWVFTAEERCKRDNDPDPDF